MEQLAGRQICRKEFNGECESTFSWHCSKGRPFCDKQYSSDLQHPFQLKPFNVAFNKRSVVWDSDLPCQEKHAQMEKI